MLNLCYVWHQFRLRGEHPLLTDSRISRREPGRFGGYFSLYIADKCNPPIEG